MRNNVLKARNVLETRETKHRLAEIERWLSPPDPSTNINYAKKLRHDGTRTWFLESIAFQEWCLGSRRHLWLQGLPGYGKTVLSATLLDHLEAGDSIVLSFFFDFNDARKQSKEGMQRSLAFQLYSRGLQPTMLEDLFQAHQAGQSQPTIVALSDVLIKMIAGQKKVTIVLDALDESTTRDEVIHWIEIVASSTDLSHVQLLCTSRPETEFIRAIPPLIGEQNCLSLDKQAINADIRAFVIAELQQRPRLVDKNLSQGIFERICDKVGDRADGM